MGERNCPGEMNTENRIPFSFKYKCGNLVGSFVGYQNSHDKKLLRKQLFNSETRTSKVVRN